MRGRVITLVGGSGFIGRHLVRLLAARGATIRVAVRDPVAGQFLKPMGNIGQITLMPANICHRPSLQRALDGADTVINLVGILYERGAQRFAAVHAEGAAAVAEIASQSGVERLVQVSAIGAAPSSAARYARTKAAGEKAVRSHFSAAIVVRPSIVFGPEDQFFNRFAGLARLVPVLPLFGGGHTRLQPVYVGDVAAAIVAALERPDCAGRTFELGGPRVYSLRQIMEIVMRETGRRCILLPVPFALAKLQAAMLQLLPVPPLTVDQVTMLETDSVVAADQPGLADLDIVPTPVDAVLPSYLARYRKIGSTAAAGG